MVVGGILAVVVLIEPMPPHSGKEKKEKKFLCTRQVGNMVHLLLKDQGISVLKSNKKKKKKKNYSGEKCLYSALG